MTTLTHSILMDPAGECNYDGAFFPFGFIAFSYKIIAGPMTTT